MSKPFEMVDAKGKTVCAIVKLKSRINEHRATITEDFQAMKDIVTAKRRQEIIHEWVVKKVKDTYVKMNPRYRNCNFEYEALESMILNNGRKRNNCGHRITTYLILCLFGLCVSLSTSAQTKQKKATRCISTMLTIYGITSSNCLMFR